MLKPVLATIALATALPASAMVLTEDFTTFGAGVDSFPVGSGLGQVISDSIGTAEAGVPAIDGTSIFMTIDTTSVDRLVPGGYGGGLRTTISDPITVGDLSSMDASDYNIVFDVAANGFEPQFVDVILAFRDSGGANLFPQVSTNQGNANFVPSIAALAAGDAPVSVSLSLDDFNLPVGAEALLPSVDQIQFQLFTRSNNAPSPADPYSVGAGNILVLDNVGIEVIPEPASLALLGMGGLCLIARRRSLR